MGGYSVQKHDTLTARNLIDAYIFAYETLYNTKPHCEHQEGRWFLINNVLRDRHWLVLEIERLRQEALSNTMNAENKPKSHIFRMIRRLSRL